MKLICCRWMNKHNETKSQEKIYYFINAWLLPKFCPEVWLPKLVLLATLVI
jgi:hypothetical protein